MEIVDLGKGEGRRIERFDSIAARYLPVARLSGDGGVGIVRLAAGGVLGRHPAVVDQLFVVIEGSGWVSGPDRRRHEIGLCQAALWRAGEDHESGTATGMAALVIELGSIVLP